MSYLVSPCCGAEYTDIVDDDGYEAHICSMCEEVFPEPVVDYEYDEQRKESIAEDRADEARDMGE